MRVNIERKGRKSLMKTVEEIKKDILKLKSGWNADDIICAFGDYEENGESEVYVGRSDNSGYDYIAYINTADSLNFCICVDENDNVRDVWTE